MSGRDVGRRARPAGAPRRTRPPAAGDLPARRRRALGPGAARGGGVSDGGRPARARGGQSRLRSRAARAPALEPPPRPRPRDPPATGERERHPPGAPARGPAVRRRGDRRGRPRRHRPHPHRGGPGPHAALRVSGGRGRRRARVPTDVSGLPGRVPRADGAGARRPSGVPRAGVCGRRQRERRREPEPGPHPPTRTAGSRAAVPRAAPRRQSVVFLEKVREDDMRDLGWQMARWTWADLSTPAAVGDRLHRAFARGRRSR